MRFCIYKMGITDALAVNGSRPRMNQSHCHFIPTAYGSNTAIDYIRNEKTQKTMT